MLSGAVTKRGIGSSKVYWNMSMLQCSDASFIFGLQVRNMNDSKMAKFNKVAQLCVTIWPGHRSMANQI